MADSQGKIICIPTLLCNFALGLVLFSPRHFVKIVTSARQVSSETGVMYDLFDYKPKHPIECMLVMLPDNHDVWQPLAFT